MKNFESYHVIPFLLAYLSLNNSYNFNTPVINITKTVYSIISLAPLIGVLALTDSDSVEHLLLVLSYAFAQRSLGSLVVLNNDKPPKVTLSNYLHIVFLISILMLVYNKKININVGYVVLISFTLFTLFSKYSQLPLVIQDYIVVHLLFFFTK